ncbi:MAG TPA: tRNA (guanosine(37)-N1)-methyltransferase TrmD [Patescibacteria group bacterium]|nr:tRNA (guanosine(37)-N1)-methyltransferase TrmD [Patescibacteria group bacterium]
MQFDILTLFPDLIYTYASESILGRAQEKKLISIKAHNFRHFSNNKWGHVDDKPYGGGPGMILRVEPIYECLKVIKALSSQLSSRGGSHRRGISVGRSIGIEIPHPLRRGIRNDKMKVIVMDPAGKKFDQRMAEKFAKLDRLVIISGRYEGFDARVYKFVDERVSVGDYVLAGGELPALTVVEAVSRLIPGVLGNAESLAEETHGRNVKVRMKNDQSISKSSKSPLKILHSSFFLSKEYPQYTRPEEFMGMKVPKVLLSGDHKKIGEWRRKQSK